MTQIRKLWAAPSVIVLGFAASAEAGSGPNPDFDGGFSSGVGIPG